MNSLVDELLNYPSQVEGIDSYINKLRAKTDVILSEANTSTHSGASTALLDVLRNISPASCPTGYALFLGFQADVLSASMFPAYVFACKGFFTLAPKIHVLLANKDGMTISDRVKNLLLLTLKRFSYSHEDTSEACCHGDKCSQAPIRHQHFAARCQVDRTQPHLLNGSSLAPITG